MNRLPRPNVALLTPRGRSAIATVVVAGPDALEIVRQRFHSHTGLSLDRRRSDSIAVGRWESASGEEVIVWPRDTDNVEIHCHGGPAASRAIIESLLTAGCHQIDAAGWFESTQQCPIARSAMFAMTEATTERSAGILWDQAAGALADGIGRLRILIESQCLADANALVDQFLSNATIGQHFTCPWQIVVAGVPNVGKSSLVNAILGFERSIVCETPGSTRDAVVSAAAIDGWPVELVDTAGLRTTSEPLEAAGMQLAAERIVQADLVILMFDASIPWTAGDEALQARFPESLCVHNKSDLVQEMAEFLASRPPGINVSATTCEGIDTLMKEIATRLVPQPPKADDPVPFASWQRDLFVDVNEMIDSGRPDQALAILDQFLDPAPERPLEFDGLFVAPRLS